MSIARLLGLTSLIHFPNPLLLHISGVREQKAHCNAVRSFRSPLGFLIKIMDSQDEINASLSTMSGWLSAMMMFTPELVEVSATDPWEWIEVDGERYPRYQCVMDLPDSFMHVQVDYIPHLKATVELKALMMSWRRNGWGDLANTVEERSEFDEDGGSNNTSIYDELTVRTVSERRVSLVNAKYYKNDWSPKEMSAINRLGLQIPFKCARIDNITLI